MNNVGEHRDQPPLKPGRFLRDRVLRGQGTRITQDELANALAVSRFTVNQIINGRRAITADMAVRLAHVLGTSPALWLDMQKEVDLFDARQKLAASGLTLTVLRQSRFDPPEDNDETNDDDKCAAGSNGITPSSDVD